MTADAAGPVLFPAPPPDYNPYTADQIALCDALDEIDLASGRDFFGAAPADDRPTSHPPGTSGRIAAMERRALLGLSLWHADDAEAGDPAPSAPAAPPTRAGTRRPSELARKRLYRLRDAQRKRDERAARRAEKEGGPSAA